MNSFVITIKETSKLLLCYLAAIYTLIFLTINIYIKFTYIKLILTAFAYLQMLQSINKDSVAQLYYYHLRHWGAIYTDGRIEKAVITDIFISHFMLILEIKRGGAKHKEIIIRDQVSENDFNLLYSTISLIKIYKT